jgi:hemoglobin/transferrin/lactoferrin receptor protein
MRWLPNWAPVDLEIVATAVGRQDDLNDPALFQAPGYVTIDLLAGWQINPSMSLRAGLFNLTDRQYWAWSNVRGRPADSLSLDRFTQPGFNAGASFTWQL